MLQPLPTIPTIPMPQIPPTLTDGVGALFAHNWYAGAAIGLMFFIQAVKKYELSLWAKTPVGFRFLWPIGLAMMAAFVHGYLIGETLHASWMDTLNAIWQIAFPAMGGAAVLKESPLPWSGGAGGVEATPEDRVTTIPAPPPTSPADLRLVPSTPPAASPAVLYDDDRKTPIDGIDPPPAA